ncbi:hypothetical protein [Psychrobacillus psychrotolerans]|uniref:hypothetical protein n=1 Tax=Psychrobacillus psychrotolerans TaxID=126156 RepID=UPI003B0273AB
MVNLTKEIHWFVHKIMADFSVEVAAEEIALEATELGLDEVEEFFVPNGLFDDLPETLVYEIMIVDDKLANVWVGAIAIYPNSPEGCLQVITKNGVMVFIETFFPFLTESFNVA